jgi:hypothetical protein
MQQKHICLQQNINKYVLPLKRNKAVHLMYVQKASKIIETFCSIHKKYCCVLHVDTQQKSDNFVANDNNVCNIGKKKLQKLSFTNDHGGTAVADFSSPHINPPYHMTIPELVDDKSGS